MSSVCGWTGRDRTGQDEWGETKDEQCLHNSILHSMFSSCHGVQLFVVCEVENIHLHWREEEEEEEERLRINDVEDNLPCLRDL